MLKFIIAGALMTVGAILVPKLFAFAIVAAGAIMFPVAVCLIFIELQMKRGE